jgi:hypothetical protein
MQSSFAPGSEFHVSGVNLKDDRLELKLEGGSEGSAKIRLLLGQGWQSNSNVNAVMTQLARVFDMPKAPVSSSSTASATEGNTQQPTRNATKEVSQAAMYAPLRPPDSADAGDVQTNDPGTQQNEAGSIESSAPPPEEVGSAQHCDLFPNSPIRPGDVSVCVEGGPVFKLELAYCYAPIACADILYNIGTAYLTGGSIAQQFCGSDCRMNPRTVPQDPHQAFLWVRWAAELGDKSAQFQAAKMYFSGIGVSRDDSQGQYWLRKAAEDKSLEERFLNGESCYFGTMIGASTCEEKDLKSAFMWFTVAAEQGHAEAMFYLGKMYEAGEGIQEDYKLALDWYTKSVQAGSADGEINLGNLYYAGRGVTQDFGKAFEWWSKAADQNIAQAQLNLGVMYEHGEGVTKDYKKAQEWYTKAAQQGNPQEWYTKAAQQGDSQEWYTKGAQQAISDAALALGKMYEYGRGVRQDYAKAEDWYKQASKYGSTEGAEKAKALKLKADAIEQADAIGYLGESPDGGEGIELIASITGSIPVRVMDQIGNVGQRELVALRLDYRNGHSNWLEMVCLNKCVRQQNSPVDDSNVQDQCNRFTSGKRYRLVESVSGHFIDFYPSSAKYPVSEYQVWKVCINTRNKCYPTTRGPIVAVRRPDGVLER